MRPPNERPFITITPWWCYWEPEPATRAHHQAVSLCKEAQKLQETGTGSKRIRLCLQGFPLVPRFKKWDTRCCWFDTSRRQIHLRPQPLRSALLRLCGGVLLMSARWLEQWEGTAKPACPQPAFNGSHTAAGAGLCARFGNGCKLFFIFPPLSPLYEMIEPPPGT